MTVEELIKELEEYPKDTEVVEYVEGYPIRLTMINEDTQKVQLVY